MSIKKKNAAVDVEPIGSGSGKRVSERAKTIPQTDYSTIQQRTQIIESLLYTGEENAISTADLMQATNIPTARQIRAQVARERAAGALILSSDRGYFLPSEGQRGRAEMERFVSAICSRALNTLRAADAVRAVLRRPDGQIKLLDGGRCT